MVLKDPYGSKAGLSFSLHLPGFLHGNIANVEIIAISDCIAGIDELSLSSCFLSILFSPP